MKIRCPGCNAAYDMDESRVPAAGVNIKCPKCSHGFRLTREGVATVDRPSLAPATKDPALVALPSPVAPAKLPDPAPPADDFADFAPGGFGLAGPPQTPAADFGDADEAAFAPAGAARVPGSSDPALAAAFALPASGPVGDSTEGSFPPSMMRPPGAPNPYMAGVALAAQGAAASAPPTDDLGMLDFVDDARPVSVPPADAVRWQVRRRNGKVFGPFDTATVLSMLHQGQLTGTEEISSDGATWVPFASEPRFASELRTDLPPGLAPAGGGRVPPPVMGQAGATGATSSDTGSPEAVEQARHVEVPEWVRHILRRLPLFAGVAAAVFILGGGISLGLFTDSGFFAWRLVFSRKPQGPSPAIEGLAAFEKHTRAGTQGGWREALVDADAAMKADPASEDARVAYVLAAGTLQRRWGAGGTELESAKQLAKKKLDERSPGGRLAAAALALAGGAGGVDTVKSLLAGRAKDPRAATLLAEAHLAAHEWRDAATLLDDVLKARPSPDAALLRAEAARAQGDEKAEEAALLQARELAPELPQAAIALARLRLSQKKIDEAATLLEAALGDPAVKLLASSEEAAAHRLRSELEAGRRNWADALREMQRASEQDPENPAIRAAQASLLLSRRHWQEAAAAYDKAIEKSPKELPLIVGAVRAHCEAGNFVKASEHLASAQQKAPADPSVLASAGLVAWKLGRPEEARKNFAEALAQDPKSIAALVGDARVLLETGRAAEAKDAVDRVAGIAPADPEVQWVLGRQRLAAGDAAEAKAAFAKALEADADFAEAHRGLALALVAAGEDEAAPGEFEKAVALAPGVAALRQEYATLLRRTGRGEAALAQLRAAQQSEPKDARIQALAGAVLLELDRLGEAEQSLRAALVLNDEEALAHDYYGRLLVLKGETGQATEQLRRAVALAPGDAGTLYQLGLVYERAQQLGDAAEAYKRALTADPKHVDAREHLGIALSGQGLCNDAIEVFRKVLEDDPKRASALVSMADCESRVDALGDRSLRHLREALELDPAMVGVHYRLGRAYEKLGRTAEAVKSYRQATEAEPLNPYPWYYLGYIYKNGGKRADGLAAFEKYLELNPKAKEAEEIKDEIFYLKENR